MKMYHCYILKINVLLWWMLNIQLESMAGACQFPDTWLGQWYQKELGDLELMTNSIDKKGICYYSDTGNKFYVKKPDGNKMCYSCLVITARHENLLQYKESRPICQEKTNTKFPRNCDIPGDAFLYTVVREKSVPVTCPFQGDFTFTYDNNTGLCERPRSKAHACAGDYSLQLHFRECPNIPGSINQVATIQCLASWRDQENYVYVKLNSFGLVHKHQMYRCMKYRERDTDSGPIVEIAATADATCLGLHSYYDAPLTLTLKKDNRVPSPSCSFPVWMKYTQWQTLSGQYLFEVDKQGTTLRLNQPSLIEDPTLTSMTCQREHLQSDLTNNTSYPVFEFVSRSHEKCKSFYQCVRFIQRSQDVIQFQTGRKVKHHSHACTAANFRGKQIRTLLAITATKKDCPYPGSHDLSPRNHKCQDVLRSGCHDKSEIRIQMCSPNHQDKQLKCLGRWMESGVSYVIARGPTRVLCFTFREIKSTIQFTVSNECTVSLETNRDVTSTAIYSFPRSSSTSRCGSGDISDIKTTHISIDKSKVKDNAGLLQTDATQPNKASDKERRHQNTGSSNTSSTLNISSVLVLVNSIFFLTVSHLNL